MSTPTGQQVPIFFTPQEIAACYIHGLVADINGDLSIGVTYDFHDLGIYGGLRFEPTRGQVELSTPDAKIENWQPTKNGFRATIMELIRDGYDSALMDIFGNYDYVGFAITSYFKYGNHSTETGNTLAALGSVVDMPVPFDGNPTVISMSFNPAGNGWQWAPPDEIDLFG